MPHLSWPYAARSYPVIGTPVSEDPGDQDGDQLMLLRALRPALRLPQDPLCTLIVSSSNLESRRLVQCPQTHRVKDWNFSTEPDLGGQNRSPGSLKPSPQTTDRFSQQLMTPTQECGLRKAGWNRILSLEFRDNRHPHTRGWQHHHIPLTACLCLQGI